jgi:hypothetical protein
MLALVVALGACGGGAAAPPAGTGGSGGARPEAGVSDAPATGGSPSAGGTSGGQGGSAGGAGVGGTTPASGGISGSGGALATDALTEAPAAADSASAACGSCASWAAPQQLGRVSAAGLDALSGLAASWRNPGIVYVHNDRNRAEVFALGETAALVARLTLGGATVQDIEDMEVSRCPAGTCLYVADIGNNISPRSEFSIYRATEPALAAGAQPDQTLPAERFAFRYADQPHNAESLLIDSMSGAVFIITKVAAGQPSTVYRLSSFETGRVNVAEKLVDLTVPAAGDQPATAGSAHPCGGGFLLRTNNTLYEFRTPLGTPLGQAFTVTPAKVPAGTEQQGEAVGYRADGLAYYTTSEGATPPLHRVGCQ